MRTSKKTSTKTSARNSSAKDCSTKTTDSSAKSGCAGSRKCRKTKDCK